MGNEHSTCGEMGKASTCGEMGKEPDSFCCVKVQESNRLGPSSWGQESNSLVPSSWAQFQTTNAGEPQISPEMSQTSACLIPPQFQTTQAEQPLEPGDKLKRWLDAQAAEVEENQKRARAQILQRQKDAVQRQKDALAARTQQAIQGGTHAIRQVAQQGAALVLELEAETNDAETNEAATKAKLASRQLAKEKEKARGHRKTFFKSDLDEVVLGATEQDIEVKSSKSEAELSEAALVERFLNYQERFKFKMESIEEEAASSLLSSIAADKAITSLASWVGKKTVCKSEFVLAMVGICFDEGMEVTKKDVRRLFSVLDFDETNYLFHAQWVSAFPYFFCTRDDFFVCMFHELDAATSDWLNLSKLEKYVTPVVQMLIPPNEQELREQLIIELSTAVFTAVDVDCDGDLSYEEFNMWSKEKSVSEVAVHCLRDILGLDDSGTRRFSKTHTVPKEMADEEKSSQQHSEHMKGDTSQKAEDADHFMRIRKRYSMQADSFIDDSHENKKFTALKTMSSIARNRQLSEYEGMEECLHRLEVCLHRFRKHIGAICHLADKSTLSELSANKALKFFASNVGAAHLDVHAFMDLTRYLANVEGAKGITDHDILDLFNALDFDDKKTLTYTNWVPMIPFIFTVEGPIIDDIFGVLDLDDSGGLSEYEIARYCTPVVQMLVPNQTPKDKELRIKLTEQLSQALFDEIDDDGDGTLTTQEFEEWFYQNGNVAEHAFYHLEKCLIEQEVAGKGKDLRWESVERSLRSSISGRREEDSTEKKKKGKEEDSTEKMVKIHSRAFSLQCKGKEGLHDDLDIHTCCISRRVEEEERTFGGNRHTEVQRLPRHTEVR